MPSSSPSAKARPSDNFLAGRTVLSTSSPAVDRTSSSLRGHSGEVQPTISQSIPTALGSAVGIYAGSGLRNSVSAIENSNHSIWPPGSAREGKRQSLSLEIVSKSVILSNDTSLRTTSWIWLSSTKQTTSDT
jgi:hypothetical protein